MSFEVFPAETLRGPQHNFHPVLYINTVVFTSVHLVPAGVTYTSGVLLLLPGSKWRDCRVAQSVYK